MKLFFIGSRSLEGSGRRRESDVRSEVKRIGSKRVRRGGMGVLEEWFGDWVCWLVNHGERLYGRLPDELVRISRGIGGFR